MFFPLSRKHHACLLDAGNILPLTTGRMGLALALEHIGIKEGDRILIPAYHCNAMVEPVINALAIPVFYNIKEDTTVDVDDLKRRLDENPRALLATHYFGFPQNIVEIRRFCDSHGLILIEDCAHVFFGEVEGKPLGSYGDYALGSPMKFFALYDGGYLISNRHPVHNIPTTALGLVFSLRGLATIIGRSIGFKRLGLFRYIATFPFLIKDMVKKFIFPLWQWRRASSGRQQHTAPAIIYGFDGYLSGQEGEFDPAWIHTGMSGISRLVISLSTKERIFKKRRENYLILLQALSDIPGCRPLHPVLAESIAPYVFPLIVDKPDQIFPKLKRLGVPISRFGESLWKGMIAANYPSIIGLSKQVMQFPCHQELTSHELQWMIAEIRKAVLDAGPSP